MEKELSVCEYGIEHMFRILGCVSEAYVGE